MTKQNVLIIGCGELGCALGSALHTTGKYSIHGVRRNILKLPTHIHPIKLDIIKPFPTLPSNIVDYVVFCAAPNDRNIDSYKQIYLTGLQNCINTINARYSSVKRFFLVSSTRVYHQNNGEWVDENSLTLPSEDRGRILLDAEEIAKNSGIPCTTIRFGGIYSLFKNHLVQYVLQGLNCKKTPPNFSNRIHLDDCTGILKFLIETDPQKKFEYNTCYLGVDSSPTSLWEVMEWLSKQLQTIPKHTELNLGHSNKRCSNKKILSTGYSFTYPNYQTGYLDILREMGTHPIEPTSKYI